MRTRIIAVAVLLVCLTGWAIARVSAEVQTSQTVTVADVVAELKLLRKEVEVNNKNQALAVAIAVHQLKVQPLSAELVSIRGDLDAAQDDIRQVSASLVELRSPVTPRDVTLRGTLKHLDARLAALRAQEQEVSQRLKAEEAAAARLVAQLQANVSR